MSSQQDDDVNVGGDEKEKQMVAGAAVDAYKIQEQRFRDIHTMRDLRRLSDTLVIHGWGDAVPDGNASLQARGAFILRSFITPEDQLAYVATVLNEVLDFGAEGLQDGVALSTLPMRAAAVPQTNFGVAAAEAGVTKSLKFCLSKLRWANLGQHHYDWGRREYLQLDGHAPLNPRIAGLAHRALQAAGLGLKEAEAASPQTLDFNMAICNFYHLQRPSDRLGGHKDDVETDLSKPLVTCSFGVPGIFLLGGTTREVEPTAILLQAGDVMVLSGEARISYHGVPTVLQPEAAHREELLSMWRRIAKDKYEELAATFLASARVNMSIREV